MAGECIILHRIEPGGSLVLFDQATGYEAGYEGAGIVTQADYEQYQEHYDGLIWQSEIGCAFACGAISPAIDVTEFTTLTVKARCYLENTADFPLKLGLIASTSSTAFTVNEVWHANAIEEKTIDITSLSGYYYVASDGDGAPYGGGGSGAPSGSGITAGIGWAAGGVVYSDSGGYGVRMGLYYHIEFS